MLQKQRLDRKLRAKYQGLELALREMISEERISAIADGRIDLGSARSGSKHPRVQASLQMSDPFCLALPPSFGLAPEGAVDLRNYSDQAFVGFSRSHGPAYFDQSIHLCSQAGFSPRIRHEASNVRGVLALVSAGPGIALVPASTVQLGVKGLAWRRAFGAAPQRLDPAGGADPRDRGREDLRGLAAEGLCQAGNDGALTATALWHTARAETSVSQQPASPTSKESPRRTP